MMLAAANHHHHVVAYLKQLLNPHHYSQLYISKPSHIMYVSFPSKEHYISSKEPYSL